MTDFPWATNLRRNDEGASVYWRVAKRLELDPIASMLAEHVRKGLAMAVHDGIVDDDNKAKFSRSGLRPFFLVTLDSSPLSILSTEARHHLAGVLYSAFIVNEEED